MAKTISIDEFSPAALLIEPLVSGKNVAKGTAFTYAAGGQVYLITNGHNLTGKHPESKERLFAEPDSLKIWLHVTGKLGFCRPHVLAIRASNYDPLWYEHPKHDLKVDVVALPLDCPDGLTVYPINDLAVRDDMVLSVGQDVFILGFPFAISVAGHFPIWKRASVASEPGVDLEDLPKMLVDTASRSGMSGSPVIFRPQGGIYKTVNGGSKMSTGNPTSLAGIYSGRIGAEDEFKAQLGIVWKASVIDEIIVGEKRSEL